MPNSYTNSYMDSYSYTVGEHTGVTRAISMGPSDSG